MSAAPPTAPSRLPSNWPAKASFWCAVSIYPLLYITANSGPSVSDVPITAYYVAGALSILAGYGFGICGIVRARRMRVGGSMWALAGMAISTLSIVLPALFLISMSRGYERHYRSECASQLRQIGEGMATFARDNGGQFPDRFDLLISDVDMDMDPSVFICMSADHTGATGNTVEELVTDFARPGRCSYVYVGAGLSRDAAPASVVAYELLSNHDGDGGNFLFADGHVEWFAADRATFLIAEIQAGFNPPRQP